MKVLFLVPHLSTGGMPQFLLKRIQALNLYTQTELFVYEWVQTSKNYTVQREQIIDIVGDNFYSCGYYEEWDDNFERIVCGTCYQEVLIKQKREGK